MIDPAAAYAVECLGGGLVFFVAVVVAWNLVPLAWGTLLWLIGRFRRG